MNIIERIKKKIHQKQLQRSVDLFDSLGPVFSKVSIRSGIVFKNNILVMNVPVYPEDIERYHLGLEGEKQEFINFLNGSGYDLQEISYEDTLSASDNVVAFKTITVFEDSLYLLRIVAIYTKSHGIWTLKSKNYTEAFEEFPFSSFEISYCGGFGDVNRLCDPPNQINTFYAVSKGFDDLSKLYYPQTK